MNGERFFASLNDLSFKDEGKRGRCKRCNKVKLLPFFPLTVSLETAYLASTEEAVDDLLLSQINKNTLLCEKLAGVNIREEGLVEGRCCCFSCGEKAAEESENLYSFLEEEEKKDEDEEEASASIRIR